MGVLLTNFRLALLSEPATLLDVGNDSTSLNVIVLRLPFLSSPNGKSSASKCFLTESLASSKTTRKLSNKQYSLNIFPFVRVIKGCPLRNCAP